MRRTPREVLEQERRTAQDWYWRQQFEHPPTTAEWLAYLRRTGDKRRYFRNPKYGWHRALRPFVTPFMSPAGNYTTGGFWWREIP